MSDDYVLDQQVGFILRRVYQRHAVIFAEGIGAKLTPTQFAALAKLYEQGPCTQNHLGRLTAMDAATIKGVVDRLGKRSLITTRPDPSDGRRMLVELSEKGKTYIQTTFTKALRISEETLAPLSGKERKTLLKLLEKLC